MIAKGGDLNNFFFFFLNMSCCKIARGDSAVLEMYKKEEGSLHHLCSTPRKEALLKPEFTPLLTG